MKQDITIIDIAKRAGVSTATVSRVLNGTGKVRSGTKEKVEAAVREMNYQPNFMAKNLSNVTSDVIGVLVSDVRNPFYAKIFVECEKYANEKGFSLLLCNYQNSEALELQYYDLLMAQRVCGIIHIGGSVDRRKISPIFFQKVKDIAERIPVITSTHIEGTKCSCVYLDSDRCMKVLMEYLLSLGHERIAFAGGRENALSTWEKIQCYKKIMKKKKLKIYSSYISESTTYDRQGGYLATRRILGSEPLPTAIIAVNDLAAMGVMQALEDYNLKVGEDISVVSFDNTYITELLTPELTSISSDYTMLAREMIDTILAMIKGEATNDVLDVSVELVKRESSKEYYRKDE